MKKELVKIIIAGVLFFISLFFSFENVWINNLLFVISYIIVGVEVVLHAVKNIFKGKVFDEHFLMSIATIGAFAIGEFPEAVAVMLFYQVGELFQDYAVDKSRDSITSLMDIRPDFANVKVGEKIEKRNPENVNIGDIIIVKPGEKIPLDGTVIEGASLVDTSALTGEAIPRKLEIGDTVLSGCINQSGLLTIKVEKEFGESTVSKILDLVENASSKKSKSENFITKFAKYYTPIVVIIAVFLAAIPPLVIEGEVFTEWLYRALTFLVVSCPCALVISIPLSFFAGVGAASKSGILVKGANYLEMLSKTEIIVFDKTGTLTKGVFEVQKIAPIGMEEAELLRLVAHAEMHSNHPISLSVKKAYNGQLDTNIVSDVNEISGHGIIAIVEGKEIEVGNNKLMQQKKIEYSECNEIGTVLYVTVDNKYVGYILIADKIKEDSYVAIKELKRNKVKQTVMLTGDKNEIATKVARELKIDKVYSELLPNDKVAKVEELAKNELSHGKLVFVGDGINDAPVLALADIGIAMGGLGSDAAIEAADVVIMTDEPSKIASAMKISRKTLKIAKENICFAILVKVGVLALAAVGVSSMWEAVFADVGVSVIAILNAIRVLRYKPKL